MRLNLTLSRKALILVSVPLIFELIFVATLTILLNQAEASLKRENRCRRIIDCSNRLAIEMYSITIRFRSRAKTLQYFQAHSLQELAEEFEGAEKRMTDEVNELKELTADNPRQYLTAAHIEEAWLQLKSSIDEGREALQDRSLMNAMHEFQHIRDMIGPQVESIAADIKVLGEEEKAIETQMPKREDASRARVQLVLAVGVVANILLALSLALNFNRGTTRRLRVLMDNTNRLAKGQPLNPPLEGSDEIAHLDKVFNDMAEALAAAAAQREEIERMKQEFVAMVSHDLRTPLTSVQAALSLLSEGAAGELPDSAKEIIDVADENVTRLIGLINDLLDVEKLQSGKLELSKSAVSLSEIFRRSAQAVDGFASRQGISIVVEETNLAVIADEDRMIQVMINLISNAVKFSPKNEKVVIRGQDMGEDTIQISVIDNGCGVPEEFKETIFERFQQVRVSDATQKGGSGLGLSICKAIVESHDGKIGVESVEGKGSTFWFSLAKASAEAIPNRGSSQVALP